METESLSNKDILKAHGKGGDMLMTLKRNGWFGWIAFFLILLTFAMFVVIDKLKPVPLIVLDEDGRVIGTIDYLSDRLTTETQLERSAQSWLEAYLSLNAATIFPDAAIALNHMSTELKDQKLEEYTATNYLASVSAAGQRSRIIFDEKEGFKIVAWKGDRAVVQMKGAIVVGLDNPIREEFNTMLDLRLVMRTKIAPLGIEVVEIEDR